MLIILSEDILDVRRTHTAKTGRMTGGHSTENDEYERTRSTALAPTLKDEGGAGFLNDNTIINGITIRNLIG